ncbi:Fe-S cluster assembly ATPase SufC [Acetilactobacillus jinshanensis]|uniref:Fe-S cluster assembly ATPase SufC n=1 Tax=Acetilactobacillus jinshanensis TaxID=1720083 RepID=A0A4P6ZK25_9LACO|nr:Fe-S cluster assembly ATPase SufC [Acetilactobacillus jinshanensis]QBP18105.1 Fe-S cluster assembly ATPase SufC [Acetilactobacillus jinshanensis]URL61900.1 Fe-S cluster assembly ATPase SufC [uncultured bacterium]
MMGLKIRNLHVKIKENNREVLKGVNLTIPDGEIHAIMGPNGTGKSTLSQTIMGSPRYQVTQGTIEFNGHQLNNMPTDARARLGLFIGMQYPMEIKGVKNADFIREAVEATHNTGDHHVSILSFLKAMHKNMNILDMDDSYAERYLNEGFSGGEKKRNEVLQMMMIQPKLAILDEIDSGLDIDALHVISRGINHMRSPHFSAMIITHYNRILKYVKPDVVHVMMDGRMVTHGGPELADRLEREGYAGLRDDLGLHVKLVDDDG